MMKDWKKVFSSAQLATASMVAGILIENEVPANVINKIDSSYVFLGQAEVVVPENLLEKAEAIVKSIQQ